jgi:hypothetical protein
VLVLSPNLTKLTAIGGVITNTLMVLTAGVGIINNNLMELCTFIIRALDADNTKNGVNARVILLYGKRELLNTIRMSSHLSISIILLMLLLSCKKKNDKYTVIVNNVEGLEEGSLVTYKGLPVGKVVSMNFYNDSIIVDFEVAKDFKIPSGSKFIVTNNILSHITLAIEPGRNKSFISINDTLRGYKDTNQFSIFGPDTAKQNNKKKSIQKIAEGFKELFEAPADSVKN